MSKSAKMIIALSMILLISFGAILLFSQPKAASNRLSIVTTNFPSYDFARAVAGGSADIKMLVSPGTETHDFEPTPQDVIDISNSDLFIYTGGESDTWVDNLLHDLDHTKTFKMLDLVSPLAEEDSHDDHEYDEHVWTSPKNAITIVRAISDQLSQISPTLAPTFSEQSADYIDRLTDLDQRFREVVSKSPRHTIIFGDRFPLRYFAAAYDLDYLAAFPGCSEQSEADPATTSSLISKITTEHIPVVFKIELSNGQIADTIARETGAKVLEFHSAHNISTDDFNSGVTYVDLMESNLAVLKEALQ